MIDMLTILVVYLLVHAADMDILPNSKNITIPQSLADQKPRAGDRRDGDARHAVRERRGRRDGGGAGHDEAQVSEPLRAALDAQAQGLLPGSEANREVTVMAEKSLPYAVLRKIVASSSAAEYTKVSLAVVEREQTYAGLKGA